jgi:hypothetical protein
MGDDGRESSAVAQHDQRERLALAGLHISQQRGHGMEGVAIDGLDGVAGAQAGLVGWRTRLHFLDADGADQELGQNARIAQVKVIVFGRGGNVEAQLQVLPPRSTVTGTVWLAFSLRRS